MNICYVCNEYPPRAHGGIGTFVSSMAHAMARAGHHVVVVQLGVSNSERVDGVVHVVTLKASASILHPLTNRLRLYSWLRNAVRNGSVEIIEVPDYQGLLPFWFPYCPVVVRLHQSSATYARIFGGCVFCGYWIAEKGTLAFHRRWISVSQWMLDYTCSTFNLRPKKSSVIMNPVTIKPGNVTTPPLPECFIVAVGYVGERKGSYVLAEAVAELLKDRQEMHLVYVGAIQDAMAKDKIYAILGPSLSKKVHFVGWLDHSVTLSSIAKAKVFVLPSRAESFGLVALEAMAMGVPVVFTNFGPGPEVVTDGKTGLLVDPYSPEDIKTKIHLILDDKGLADDLIRNGKCDIEKRFSVEQCRSQTEEFYRTCLG